MERFGPPMKTHKVALLEDCRSTLARVRTAAPNYSDIEVATSTGPDGYLTDDHRQTRAKCLWAMQYEPRPVVDPLVEALLRAETQWHRVAPFQGYTDELKLAAYLVALHPPPGVLELMWNAKRANFDTWCGFDSQFLAAGGVDEAVSLASTANPVDDDLLGHLLSDGAPRFTDAEVSELLEEMAQYFPSAPEDEPPFTWFERARLLGDSEGAKAALDDWSASPTPPSDESLQYYLGSIGLFADAVTVQRRVVAEKGGERSDPSTGIRLAELLREAGQLAEAMSVLRRSRRGISPSTDANGYRRRCLAEEGFRLAMAAEGRLAAQAFAFADDVAADRSIRQMVTIVGAPPSDEWLPLVVLEAGWRAANAVGDAARAAHYEDRARRERRRIGREDP